MELIKYPNPILLTKSVTILNPRVFLNAPIIEGMLAVMVKHGGVGLAAPQVGRNIRLFITNHTGKMNDLEVYINPVILDAKGTATDQEGCLSVEGVTVQVTRKQWVKLGYVDSTGTYVEKSNGGLLARVWQHEIDHLDGLLINRFVDHQLGFISPIEAKEDGKA